MDKVLALTRDGRLTYCYASDDWRGKGRCNHIAHIEKGETQEDFIKRARDKINNSKKNKNKNKKLEKQRNKS